MKLADIDWQVLRGGLLVFPVALVASFLLLRAGYYFFGQMAQQYEQCDRRFIDVSRKYLSIDEDHKIISELYPRFVELYNRGVIGQEQRLNWYEALHRLSDSGVPGLTYQIQSRQVYKPAFNMPESTFEVFASDMKLDLELLHENDLVKVFGTLERDAAGFFTVERCDVRRARANFDSGDKQPNLKASCLLRWYTLNLRNGTELQLP